MKAFEDFASAQPGPRMALTRTEYEKARGLVTHRPDKISELGIESDEQLPWSNPDELLPGIPWKVQGVGDLATHARMMSTNELIEFISNPRAYSPDSASFPNRYVRAWIELRHRVNLFEQLPVSPMSTTSLGQNEISNKTRDPEAPISLSADWDVFLSHASEDKEDFANPLAQALKEKGIRVWFDEFTLRLGQSLSRSIEKGLANSRYGIVIISPAFLSKEWPQKELAGLMAREVDGRELILPVWHNIDAVTLRRRSPILADRKAVSSSKGVDQVVDALIEAMKSLDAMR